MLTSDLMRTMPTFINYKKQDTTEEYYERNKVTDVVMTFVRTSNKAFGEKHMEGFARDFFRFKKKKSTEHDHVMEDFKIEQKSARYAIDGTFNFQHIVPSHDWDFLLLSLLDFDGIRFFIASKKEVKSMIKRKVIVNQGGQGWTYKPRRNNIEADFHPVNSEYQLISLLYPLNNLIL